jgi:hypothetical protein
MQRVQLLSEFFPKRQVESLYALFGQQHWARVHRSVLSRYGRADLVDLQRQVVAQVRAVLEVSAQPLFARLCDSGVSHQSTAVCASMDLDTLSVSGINMGEPLNVLLKTVARGTPDGHGMRFAGSAFAELAVAGSNQPAIPLLASGFGRWVFDASS